MFALYQRSVLQTEILQNLQDEIAEIEQEEKEEEEEKTKKTSPISHHVFSAASVTQGGKLSFLLLIVVQLCGVKGRNAADWPAPFMPFLHSLST